jgi:hypothetical protein
MAHLLRLITRFLLTAGFYHLRLQSPPSSAPVDLAHVAWSTPASLAGAPALALRCLRCPPHCRVGWMATATPTSPPCYARPWARCRPPRRRSLRTVALLLQPRLYRRVAALVFYLAPLGALLWVSPPPPCFCALAMVAWPASQACLPMLLLCHAVVVAQLKLVLLLLLFGSSMCC